MSRVLDKLPEPKPAKKSAEPSPKDCIIQTAAGEVEYRDASHAYWLKPKDGSKMRRLPGVTTVLGELNKPALVGWAANVGGDAVVANLRDRLQTITTSKVPCGTCGGHSDVCTACDGSGTVTVHDLGVTLAASDIEALGTVARRQHIEIRDEAGRVGNLVHQAIEEYHANFWDFTPPDDERAVRAWDAFRAWMVREQYEVVESERIIVDRDARFAGRFDLLLRHVPTGALKLADAKTSKGIYREHVMQNGPYAVTYENETGTQVDGTMVIHCHPDSPLMVVERTREEFLQDFAHFEYLLELKEHSKGIAKAIKAAGVPTTTSDEDA